jgi:hypothetical protein
MQTGSQHHVATDSVDYQNWHDCANRSDRCAQTGQTGLGDITSPLRSSRRDDRNAYIEHPICSSYEGVMTLGRLDPHRTGQTA